MTDVSTSGHRIGGVGGSNNTVGVSWSRFGILPPLLASIAFVLELTLAPATLPAIRSQFGSDVQDLALYLNIYSIAVAIGVILSGQLGDRYSKMRILTLGTALFSMGSFGSLISESFQFLLFSRCIQGAGAGLFLPMIPILIARQNPDKPGRTLISLGAATGFIAALAPLVYGLIWGEHDWHMPYACLALLGLLSTVAACCVGEEDAPGLTRNPTRSSLKPFKSPGLLGLFAYVFCTYGAVTYFLFQVPLWLTDGGHNAGFVGIALTLVWLSFSTVSLALRNIVDREWLMPVLALASLPIAVSILLLTLSPSVITMVGASLMVGAGLACSNSPSTQLILRLAPKDLHAMSSSIDITSARLGGILVTTTASVFLPTWQTATLLALLAGAMLATRLVKAELEKTTVENPGGATRHCKTISAS